MLLQHQCYLRGWVWRLCDELPLPWAASMSGLHSWTQPLPAFGSALAGDHTLEIAVAELEEAFLLVFFKAMLTTNSHGFASHVDINVFARLHLESLLATSNYLQCLVAQSLVARCRLPPSLPISSSNIWSIWRRRVSTSWKGCQRISAISQLPLFVVSKCLVWTALNGIKF